MKIKNFFDLHIIQKGILFANRIDNYIFIQKLADEKGNEITIDDTPAYQFAASDARLLGGEARVDVHPLPRLHIGNGFSYVNSVQLHQPSESKYLPLTPAPRWISDIKYEFICGGRTFDNLFLKVNKGVKDMIAEIQEFNKKGIIPKKGINILLLGIIISLYVISANVPIWRQRDSHTLSSYPLQGRNYV